MSQLSSSKSAPEPTDVIWNVPNVLSAVRLLLSFVVFALMEVHFFLWAFILFFVAAGTDWIDGWWARRFNQITKLGRVLDPFCDKILICGIFILLATKMTHVSIAYGVSGILAVIVVGRELLVTALRSTIEGSGGDFSAKFSGKLKMVFQCATAGAGLLYLHFDQNSVIPVWLPWVLGINVWLALFSTLYSGWEYVLKAIQLQRGSLANPGVPETDQSNPERQDERGGA